MNKSDTTDIYEFISPIASWSKCTVSKNEIYSVREGDNSNDVTDDGALYFTDTDSCT